MGTGDFQERRVSDYRFSNLERLMEALQDDFAEFRDSFTLARLDERYMPRKELEIAYVPRAEHNKRHDMKTDTGLKILMASAAIGNFALAAIVLVTHSA